MRCLITGATGFIGSHLTQLLLDKGCTLACLIPPGEDPWRIQEHLSSMRVLESDFAGVKNIGTEIRKFQPQILIHLGWYGVDKGQRNDFEQIRQNLYGSLDLLAECLEAGCEGFIGLGSQAEYGQTDQILEEELAAHPDTLYGAVKLSTSLLAQRICTNAGVRFAWLRLTAAYGPKDNPTHLIPYVISTLLQGDEPALTHGKQKWDYLYVEDVAAAIWSLIDHPAAEGIFNLSAGRPVRVREVCQIIRDQIDPALSLGFGRVISSPEDRMALQAKNERLRQATGWAPMTSLETGLKNTVIWYKQQRRPQH